MDALTLSAPSSPPPKRFRHAIYSPSPCASPATSTDSRSDELSVAPLGTSSSSSASSTDKKSTSPRLPTLQLAIAQRRGVELRLPSLTDSRSTSSGASVTLPSATPSTGYFQSSPSPPRPPSSPRTNSMCTSALQLSMPQCATPHFLPGVPLCPEASPTDKRTLPSASSSSSSATIRLPDDTSDLDEDEDDDEGEDATSQCLVTTATTPASTAAAAAASSSSSSSSSKKRKKGSRRGTLNAEAKSVLKAWMFSPEHFAHPYPSEDEKEELAAEAGIEVKQLSNWFTNARKRLWQPVLRQSGVEVKNFLSTGRGGPRGTKLEVPLTLKCMMAQKSYVAGSGASATAEASTVAVASSSTSGAPVAPLPEVARLRGGAQAGGGHGALKRSWADMYSSSSSSCSSTTVAKKKKTSGLLRRRTAGSKAETPAGPPHTSTLTMTATQLSHELRRALAANAHGNTTTNSSMYQHPHSSVDSSHPQHQQHPRHYPPHAYAYQSANPHALYGAVPTATAPSSAATFQELEILAAASLLGLHRTYQPVH